MVSSVINQHVRCPTVSFYKAILRPDQPIIGSTNTDLLEMCCFGSERCLVNYKLYQNLQ